MPYITQLSETSRQASSGHGRETKVNEDENDVELEEVTKDTRKRLTDVEKDEAMSKCAYVVSESGMRQKMTIHDKLPNTRKSEPMALAISGTVHAVLGTILHIIGYSTQHWMESFKQAHTRFDRLGLWTVCFNNFEYDRDQLGKMFNGCNWIYSYDYKPIFDWLNPDWFLNVQIMMTIVLIINTSTSLSLIKGLRRKISFEKISGQPQNFSDQFAAFILMFTSGILMSLSVTLFGIKSKVDRQWFPRPDQNYLSWSFGLVVVSGFFAIFSAMCLLVDCQRIRWDQIKQKKRRL